VRHGEKGIPEEEEKDNEDSKSVEERIVPSFLSVSPLPHPFVTDE